MVTVHSAPFAKPPLRGSPLLRSSFLLIRRRSLRTFMQADFHASMKSAHRNVRVNCNFECSKDHRSLYPVLCIMRFLERNVFFNCNVFCIYCRSCSYALFCKILRHLCRKANCREQKTCQEWRISTYLPSSTSFKYWPYWFFFISS